KDFPERHKHTELKQGRQYLVVYVGVMGTQDGIGVLLESIHHFVHKLGRRDTQFALIGSGTELPRQKARSVDMGLSEFVTFTGPLYGEDLLTYLSSADVGVSPDPSNIFNNKLTM